MRRSQGSCLADRGSGYGPRNHHQRVEGGARPAALPLPGTSMVPVVLVGNVL